MQFITGQHRQQTYFATLDDQVAADNPVRLMDAFTDKLEPQKLGFQKTVHNTFVVQHATSSLALCARRSLICWL